MGKHGSPLYPWRVWLAGKQRSTVNSPNSNHIMLFIEIGVDDKILLPRKIILSKIFDGPRLHYCLNIQKMWSFYTCLPRCLCFHIKTWQNAVYWEGGVHSRFEFRAGHLNWSTTWTDLKNRKTLKSVSKHNICFSFVANILLSKKKIEEP